MSVEACIRHMALIIDASIILIYFVAYIDRTNLSVALATNDFKDYFRLTDADRGLLNSAFFWSYAFLQIPAGWLVDRYGVKIPYAISFLAWSLISAATAMANSVSQLFALRFLLGVGESVVTPASMRWIRFHFAEKERGLAVGLYMTGTKIGPAIGAPIAAWLVAAYGWRPMFAVLGLGCLIWLVPWLLLVKNDDRAIEKAGRQVLERLEARLLLVTRGSQGMVLFERDGPVTFMPIFGSDQIADVTGAGDTVISAFTTALAAGALPAEAAWLANVAGGLVVMKRGTATVTPADFAQALATEPRSDGPRPRD